MSKNSCARDQRITAYTHAIEQLGRGDFELDLPAHANGGLGRLGTALLDLAGTLKSRCRELEQLNHITSQINAGLLLDEILENVYQDFRGLIPYNRIGLSLLEDEGQTVRAHWAKTDQPQLKLGQGYEAPLAGSSLETIITTGQPRILNDLTAYLEQKPASHSTRLMVAEGICSSLTCPLIADGKPVGFLFFSSVQPGIYSDAHVEILKQIAGQLSVIVEKGLLTSRLAAQKAAIQTHNRELHKLDELKNAFLGMAAHDLRTPIAYIQTVTTLLMDSPVELSAQERQKLLLDANRQSQHMLNLIDELLDVAKIETGRLELHLAPIDLDSFLTQAVERHNKMAASKNTQVHLAHVPAGTVLADAQRLRQVVDNLISNAIKYSPPGSNVQISVQRTPAAWRVSVQDEGPGITAADRERLFQDFARLSARPTGGEKSTGLGLAITRRMVEAHGGQIGVESQPGQGAIFWFTLPCQPPPAHHAHATVTHR